MSRLLALVLMVCLILPAWAGDLEGTVTIKTALKKRPTGKRSRFPRAPGSDASPGYRDPQANASQRDTDEVRNVVVHLVEAGPVKPMKAQVVQKGRTFIPFVTAVTVGSVVDFPNQDVIYHSVYSDSSAKTFHLPEYAQGENRQVTMDKPGVVELFCAIHSHMNAYVLVLPTRFFTSPDEKHHFRIEGIPAGKYVVKAWHPLLEPVTKVVEIKASGSSQADFTL